MCVGRRKRTEEEELRYLPTEGRKNRRISNHLHCTLKRYFLNVQRLYIIYTAALSYSQLQISLFTCGMYNLLSNILYNENYYIMYKFFSASKLGTFKSDEFLQVTKEQYGILNRWFTRCCLWLLQVERTAVLYKSAGPLLVNYLCSDIAQLNIPNHKSWYRVCLKAVSLMESFFLREGLMITLCDMNL